MKKSKYFRKLLAGALALAIAATYSVGLAPVVYADETQADEVIIGEETGEESDTPQTIEITVEEQDEQAVPAPVEEGTSSQVAPLGDVTPLANAAYAIDPAKVVGSSLDYVAAKYEGVGENSVFDVVSIEYLQKLVLQKDEKAIILLASPRNATSQATLSYINEVAKQKGIQKIFILDLYLGGEYGYDGADITDPEANSTFVTLWTKLKTPTTGSTANVGFKYVPATYNAADTYLYVYDRKGGEDTADTTVTSLLVEDPATVTADVNAFKAQVGSVLDGLGGATENRASNYDYFVTAFSAASPKVNAFYGDAYYQANPEKFKLVSVTSPELIHILETPGTHNILVSGSWCPDSRAAIGYISENATRYDSGPVYVWDWRSDATSTVQFSSSDTAGSKPTAGWVYARILYLLGGVNSGTANTVGSNYIDGNPSNAIEARVSRNLRSPYLAKVQVTTAGQPAEKLNEWIHEAKNYELPWHYSVAAGAEEGYLLDYELSSGYLTNAQKALGRAAIGTYFAGSSLTLGKPSTSVSTTVSKEDNGCGDDNDPLDNLGEDTLIPNHGTRDYDVQHYDITITYDPTTADKKKAVDGVTVVTAVASKNIKVVSLDLRALSVDNDSVTATVNGEAAAIAGIARTNVDEEDLNKIDFTFAQTIAAGQTFTITIPYSTGILDAFVSDGQSPQGFFTRNDDKGIVAIGEPLGATYWFPNNNTPYDGASYTITLKAPTAYTLVSNGVRTSNTTASGTRTTVWNVTQDTASYQIFAYISNDVTEFGGTSSANYPIKSQAVQQITVSDPDSETGTKVIPGLSYVNKSIYDANASRNRDKVDTYFNQLPYYIAELEKIAGPYPGEAAGFVFESVGNGLGENAGWGAVETKDRPFFTSTGITSENTFVHEYAHQWYGNAVRIAAWEDLWLNEGFATYVTDLFYENTQGFDTQAKWQNVYTKTAASKEWWTYAPAKIEREGDLFGGASAAYNRGALALAALRASVGDEDFFAILKGWVATYKGQAVTTADFIAYAESVAEVDLTNWANDWLYGQVKPAAWPELLGDGDDEEEPEAIPTPTAIIAGPATAKEGDSVAYVISLADLTDAGNLILNVNYSNLTFVSASVPEGSKLQVLDATAASGAVSVTLWSTEPVTVGSTAAEVVTLTFTAGDAGEASVTLASAQGAYYTGDTTADYPAIELPDGESTSVITEVAESFDAFDFNRDGKVTLADLTYAQKYYRASEETGGDAWATVTARGIDVNGDKIIDVADYIIILGHIKAA
ncbi:MAG: hypothetical protein LBR14_03125 [Clostridiales Family XIII bacterium]|jgi:hypothetical protein|nr:hypothetical protein [Clostridiales Family XIII bacterium]